MKIIFQPRHRPWAATLRSSLIFLCVTLSGIIIWMLYTQDGFRLKSFLLGCLPILFISTFNVLPVIIYSIHFHWSKIEISNSKLLLYSRLNAPVSVELRSIRSVKWHVTASHIQGFSLNVFDDCHHLCINDGLNSYIITNEFDLDEIMKGFDVNVCKSLYPAFNAIVGCKVKA